MKVSGKMDKDMVMEFFTMQMGLNMKVNGETT